MQNFNFYNSCPFTWYFQSKGPIGPGSGFGGLGCSLT